ncbi:MAG: hypothetical protein EOQ69_15140 [Mesorhizobium sp.]|nr:MAG: hypothetical protein EOQ69_15140 [Mesorhizobium sp.]
MNRSAQFNPETFLVHARKAAPITRETEDTICSLVEESINRYLENVEEFFNSESGRLRRIVEGLSRSLAATIANKWTFDVDDESAPFHDEASAFAWLSPEREEPVSIGHYEDFIVPGRDEFFQIESDWLIRSIWNVRKEYEAQYWNLLAWYDSRWKDHWNRPPGSPARLPTDLQGLIQDLCQIWHDHVDRGLRLPRKDPEPDSPLLRFIDVSLTVPLGDQRPAKKTVLDFVSKHCRPLIRRKDAKIEMLKRGPGAAGP